MSRPETLALPIPSNATTEVLALKTQVASMREYNEAFFTTVYWALGTVATVALLLVGFNWYTNFRIADREREAIKTELSVENTQAIAKLSAEIQAKLAALESNLAQLANEEASKSASRIEKSIEGVRNSLNDVYIRVIRIEADAAAADKYKVNTAISLYIELAGRVRASYEIEDCLEKIEELVAKDPDLSSWTLTELTRFLDSLPPERRILADRIRGRLTNQANK